MPNDSEREVDGDVITEEERVSNSQIEEHQIRTLHLVKHYGKGSKLVKAVNGVTFGVSFGECFALLGVNGAGKSSTFKSLTSEIKPSSGALHIGGYNVHNRAEFAVARKMMGYCPQQDCLFLGLTVKEHLNFYAKIKGVPQNVRHFVVEKQLDEMNLREYENT